MSFLAPNLSLLRGVQLATMTDTVDIFDLAGALVANDVACRRVDSRLFAEPADPQDANMRSMHEIGVTLPLGTNVEVGYTLTFPDGMSVIAGEVLKNDTWATAIRVWANKPKTASPTIGVTLYRPDGLGNFSQLQSQTVQIVYDRNEPVTTPLRYAPAGRSSYKGGWLIGTMSFDVQAGDRFLLGTQQFAGYIEEVLPYQPQRIEARFVIDTGGNY